MVRGIVKTAVLNADVGMAMGYHFVKTVSMYCSM
jgi:hypothetical protein